MPHQDPESSASSAALGALVAQHGPWLVSWFRRRAPHGVEPEDLAQEALLVLCRRRADAARFEGAGPFLLEVARRLVLAAQRDVGRRPSQVDVTALAASPAVESEPLGAALAALPDDLQQAVDVYYSRDVTYEEAAAILGTTRATVQSRLRRALALLRRRIERQESRT